MARPLLPADTTASLNLAQAIDIATDAIVSKTLIDTGGIKQILFALDGGQEISSHQAPFPATVHVLSGRMRLGLAGEDLQLQVNDFVLMKASEPHDLTATEPVRFLLTLIKAGS